MASKLISLNFRASEELPSLEDLKAYLATEFSLRVPGFAVLEHDTKWGDSVLDLVGKTADGTLVVVFPSVSVNERELNNVLAGAMIVTSWLEDNPDEAQRRYRGRGVDLRRPLRMILVAPSIGNPSRSVKRALERAGLEMMPYAIYDLMTPNGVLSAVSFDEAPVSAPSSPREAPRREAMAPTDAPAAAPEPPRFDPAPRQVAEPSSSAVSASEPLRDEPAPKPESTPEPMPAAPTRPPSAVESFVASIGDAKLKGMADQIVTFFQGRFPTANGVVNDQSGFTLRIGKEHLVTVRLDRTSVWLEVGSERIPTSKIKDPATLDRAMTLPSVLDALQSVRG